MPQRPRTAVLFFSRTAVAEARAKTFGSGRHAGRIAAALERRTLRTLAAAGLSVFRSHEANQRGTHFGQRLATAIGRVLSRGIDRVLVVGNDCPRLSARQLRSAARRLEAGRPVLGPDARGGVYLIGLHRADFRAAAFAALPWETDRVAQALNELFPAGTLLRPLKDYNTLADLRRDAWTLLAVLAELAGLLSDEDSLPVATGPRAAPRTGARYGRPPPVHA